MVTKYKKYIIDRCDNPSEGNEWSPAYKEKDRTRILRLDDAAFDKTKIYSSAVWFWPEMMNTDVAERSSKRHVHDYDEVLGLIGSDFDNPYDLCGETEITIGDETHIVDKSALIYIPAGVEHGPFRERRIDRPILHFEFSNRY